MSAPPPLRVVIVEDHALFAQSLELALALEGHDVRRVEVPAEPAEPGTLLGSIDRLRPGLVLLDLDLGGSGSGAPLIAPLAAAGVAVVVVTGATEPTRWGEALHLGARTVLSKSRPLADVLTTVRHVGAGRAVLAESERRDLIGRWQAESARLAPLAHRLDALTRREAEVLGQLMLGRSVREIAALGVVSQATVRTQVKAVLGKLEVSSQHAAVGVAHRAGWRPPAPRARPDGLRS